MFRDDRQLARACRGLTSRILSREAPFWTDEGPTRAAVAHRDGSPMAPSARALLGVAWALWTGSAEGPSAGELLRVLDGENLGAVGRLFVAVAGTPEDVDRWIADESFAHGEGMRGAGRPARKGARA